MAIDTEDEQLETFKAWWRKNGLSLMIAVALALAALVAWHFWQSHQETQAREGSVQYQRLLSSIKAGQAKDAERLSDGLQKNYAGTPYAAQGAMVLAAYQVRHDKLGAANKRLSWVIKNANNDDMKHLAQLRRARVLQAKGKSNDALKLLQSAKPGHYKGLFKELEGDILSAQNKRKSAIKAYQAALASAGGPERTSIERKLNDLGAGASDS